MILFRISDRANTKESSRYAGQSSQLSNRHLSTHCLVKVSALQPRARSKRLPYRLAIRKRILLWGCGSWKKILRLNALFLGASTHAEPSNFSTEKPTEDIARRKSNQRISEGIPSSLGEWKRVAKILYARLLTGISGVLSSSEALSSATCASSDVDSLATPRVLNLVLVSGVSLPFRGK